VSKDPGLSEDLERLVEPVTRGDPESPLRWTSKSVRKLAKELQRMGHQVSHELVSELLHRLGYSLQANRKTREGGEHPDRDEQFEHLNAQAAAFLAAGEPAVSVDAKKKELVGDFKNPGREWHPLGEAEDVRVYDFPIKGLGRATPYGVYDLGRNAGWVNVGIDHDTAAFAVQSIRSFWNEVGREQYPQATRLLISADGGGSNGSRVRLWKWELQQLADETGLAITVCHLPPGTSKWNKIEHRLFAWISQNWHGKPLVDYAVIVKLIAAAGNQTLVSMYSPDVKYNVDAAHDLLLVYSTNSADSALVKDYYLAHRPMAGAANVLGIGYPPQETMTGSDYTNALKQPILNWMAANPTRRPQYWICMLGVPSRVNAATNEGSYPIPHFPSVSYRLHTEMWNNPFVTYINMNGTNDCKGYIDKLERFGTNYSPQSRFRSRGSGYRRNSSLCWNSSRASR
jgi:hypothetical protein